MHPREFLNERLQERFGASDDDAVMAAPLTDDEWVAVSHSADAIRSGDHTAIETALKPIVEGRRTWVLPRKRARAGQGARRKATGRAEAVAALLVSHLQTAEDPGGVVAFRREILGGRLRAPPTIARWIAAQQQQASTGFTGRTLAYRIPSSEWTRHVATHLGSTLERLRVASTRVAALTGWAPANATVFILTGEVPSTTAVRAELHYDPTRSVCSRIVLTIDPTSTPAEVATAYRRFRGGNFGRVRRLGAKHTALAHFTIEHAHLSPREQMTRWNAERGRPRYRQLNQFTRDGQQARRRLAEPLRPPRFR